MDARRASEKGMPQAYYSYAVGSPTKRNAADAVLSLPPTSSYTTPWSIIESATLRKPAMLAPLT